MAITTTPDSTQTKGLPDRMFNYLPRTRSLTTYVLEAGIIAGLVMTILLWAARMFGLTDMSTERGLGSMVLGYTGASSWMVGLVLNLAISAVMALVYAEVFRRVGFASATFGAGLGLIHWIITGVFAGIMPYFHPLMPTSLAAPGYFGLNDGAVGFVFLLALHIVFGAIVGDAYRRALRSANSSTNIKGMSAQRL